MLDVEGSIVTARQCKNSVQAEDGRVDLIVQELDRYNIRVAALQETKWYESTVYVPCRRECAADCRASYTSIRRTDSARRGGGFCA